MEVVSSVARKNYIDNLRTLIILLLFPFHTLRMFTDLEPFYVEGKGLFLSDIFLGVTSIWFMNMLFVLAGISVAFSLRKRTIKEFLKERVTKLLIPFLFGVVLTIPIQTYYAERFHNQYQGGFFKQIGMFFTKESDLTGYYGGFTPAHLWFILFLFLISIFSLPVLVYVKKKGGISPFKRKPSILNILPWFVIIMLASVVEMGESIGQYMAYFLLGFLLLQREEILQMVQRNKWILTSMAVVLLCAAVVTNRILDGHNVSSNVELIFSAVVHLTSWITILALLGLGQFFLDFKNKYTTYFGKNSFSIYFVHQTFLIVLGYYILRSIPNTYAQIVIIMLGGFCGSVMLSEILSRIPVVRVMFGMKR